MLTKIQIKVIEMGDGALCEICHCAYDINPRSRAVEGANICPECITEDYVACSRCEILVHREDARSGLGDLKLCEDCADDC